MTGGGDPRSRAALSSTEANGFGGLHNLCHGDLGNLDLLLLAARDLDDGAWRSKALRHASSVIEHRREAGGGGATPFTTSNRPH